MAAEEINIDLAQTVNIECIEKDTFDLSLNIKNLDDTDYNFSLDDLVVFNVYDSRGKSIFICASHANINNDSLDNLAEGGNSLSFAENEEERLEGRARGEALGVVLNTNKKLITGTYWEGQWSVPSNEYQLVSCNRDVSITIGGPGNTYKFLRPCITYGSGLIKINIQSTSFLLLEGKYNYEIKILSNLIRPDDVHPNILSTEIEGYGTANYGEGSQAESFYLPVAAEFNAHNYSARAVYNNAKTWLNGSLIVKKY